MIQYDKFILWDEYSPEESVNAHNLQKYTSRIFNWDSKDFDVSSVKEVHILGSSAFGLSMAKPWPGCYINKEKNWILLLRPSSDLICKVVAECCENLEYLDMRFLPVDMIDMSRFSKLTTLKLMDIYAREEWYQEMLRQSGLKKLTLRATQGGMGLDFSKLKNLEDLSVHFIAENHGVLKVKGFSELKKLRKLDLFNISLSDGLDIGTKLTELNLDKVSHCGLRLVTGTGEVYKPSKLREIRIATCEVPGALFADCGGNQGTYCRLPELEKLVLEGCRLDSLPDISNCRKLTELVLKESQWRTIGDFPAGLVRLDLSHTSIKNIPQCVERLRELTTLDLRKTDLGSLPLWLSKLGLPLVPESGKTEGILLYDAKVAGILQNGPVIHKNGVYEWLKKQQSADYAVSGSAEALPSDQNEVKVVFLGDGEAGKSMLIKRLLNNGEPIEGFRGDSTPGIAITRGTVKLSDDSDKTVRVNYWEFGGQEILHAMHRVFLTQNTVYVVILNARNDTQDERARFWLRYLASIKAQTDNAKAIIVVNKIDQNPQASMNETELRQIRSDLGDVIYLSALTTAKSDFNRMLTKRLVKEVAEVYKNRTGIPDKWLAVKKALEAEDKNIISEERFNEICTQAGVKKEKKHREALANVLCEYGTCFRCGTHGNKTKVLLRPDWVTNGLYKILVNQHQGLRNGILSYDDIRKCMENKGGNVRCTRPDLDYSPDTVDYILNVMQDNELSFSIGGEDELIPMLCQRNANAEVLAEYVDTEKSIEVWWQFDYLPQNLFFRLIVKLQDALQRNMLWMTGAVFQKKGASVSVLIRRDGDALKFYAMGEDRSAALEYLTEIEKTAFKLVKDYYPALLKEDEVIHIIPEREQEKYYPGIDRKIIFKDGKKREVFDFLHLKLGQIQKIHTCYSTILNRRVPVSQILTFGGSAQNIAESLLLQDILESCNLLQGDVAWEKDKREDRRNSQVRNYLKIKGYYVQDQTYRGQSAGSSQSQNELPGKLDLLISKDSDTPWAIYEGLNNRTETYWEDHLDKLMTKYNTDGMKLLFLVTYVDNRPENFEATCDRYWEYIKDYSPKTYQKQGPVQEVNTEYLKNYNKMQVWQCTYTQDVKETTVYHILVQLGKYSEEK